jgi:hypothetical protein
VVTSFIDFQGEDLTGGLVFREFVELEPLTAHSKSGMPLSREYRTVFLDGEPLLTADYWDEVSRMTSLHRSPSSTMSPRE